MYKNILIPVSFDAERDVAEAVEIANAISADGAKLTFIHVLEELPAMVIDAIPADTLHHRKEMAQEKIAELIEGSPHAHGAIVEGRAGRAITNYASEHSIDCIVIPSHRPVLSDIFLGSTAAWVVRHAECPVHVIR